MLNKDKRSLLLSLAIGDGCLHYIKNKNKIYGGLTIVHGIAQSDYQSWKAELLSTIMNKNVRMKPGHKGNSIQVSICMKRIRAWRKFCYPNNRKSIPRILRYIRHPEFALAVWLMDDGYVELSKYKNKVYGARLRLFVCDQTELELEQIGQWFKEYFDVDAKAYFQKTRNKCYPYIKFNQKDSQKIWSILRSQILRFKSMRHKFRHIEHLYQLRLLQRPASNK